MSLLDSSTAKEKDDKNHNGSDGAPLRFTLRDTILENHELSIKKSPMNKSKVGEKAAPQKGYVRRMTIKIKKAIVWQNNGIKAPSHPTANNHHNRVSNHLN